MADPESQTLLFQPSPYGNPDAIVEHDGRTVYFYLNGPAPFGMRACWVANLQTGPLEFNLQDLQAGQAPLLPRVHCIDPNPSAIPDSDDLEIVWFEEGNGAALSCQSRILAVIPPWSGIDGFHGYAANCASENRICWPIPPGPEIEERVSQAREFWTRWNDDPPFRTFQPAALERYAERFGEVEKYFAIDGGKFPPRGLVLLKDRSATRYLVTVGISLCPQPGPVSDSIPDNFQPHIELALRIPASMDSDDAIDQLSRRMSSLAGLPWKNFSWLGHGHSCDFLQDHPELTCAVFCLDPKRPGASTEWELPDGIPGNSPSCLLWVLPLSREKLQQLRAGDFQIEQLIP